MIETPNMLNEQNYTINIPALSKDNIICSEESHHVNEGSENNYQTTVFDWTNNIKEFETINGTWVYHEDLLFSFLINSYNFSWGTGRKIPHASIDFDLGKKMIFLEAYGGYIIDQVYKDENDTIFLILYSADDRERFYPRKMEVKFIDNNKAYITCHFNLGQIIKTLSPEEPWIWYRLSGPGY